jgi:SAM-dependent methyltransferase
VGLDLSEGMVSEYNTCANNQGLTHSEMHAMVADLCSPDLPKQLSQPEYQNFDVAICMFAFHHFPNPALAAKKIAERLRPDGVFAVVDFRPTPDFDRVPSSLKKMVSHNGFSDEDIKGWFSGAGLSEPTFVEVGPKDGEGKGITAFGIDKDTREKLKMTREAFLACGKRLQL